MASKKGATAEKEVEMTEEEARLSRLKIWSKLAMHNVHLVSKMDSQNLFTVLDPMDRQELPLADLDKLRQVKGPGGGVIFTEDEFKVLKEDCGKRGTGKFNADDLHWALTEGDLAYHVVKGSLVKKIKVGRNECTRDDLIAWMKYEHESKQALFSLPLAIVLFIIFIVMTSTHVDQLSAYYMIFGFTNFAGDPSFNDISGLKSYLSGTLLGSMLVQDLQWYPNPGRIGSYQQLIGGMRVTATNTPPYDCGLPHQFDRVYDNQFGGRCYKSDDLGQQQSLSEYFFYHVDKAVSKAKLGNLTKTDWLSVNTTSVEIEFLMYNGHYRVFTHYDMYATFDNVGKGKMRIERESWKGDPYFDWQPWVHDAMFILILCRMIYSEMKQLLPALANGLAGFFEYMNFWSAVDWLTVFCGFGYFGIWGYTVKVIYADFRNALSGLASQELDYAVNATGAYLNLTTYKATVDASGKPDYLVSAKTLLDTTKWLSSIHGYMRVYVFLYVFILILKFFKAFRANPRLDVVVRTLTGSTVDVIHFAFVFFSILAVFAYSGFFAFGSQTDGQEGQAWYALIHMWMTIVGNAGNGSPVGTYEKTLFRVWLLVYAFLMLNVLLGMLLGVVFDAYFSALGAVSNPQTLSEQLREAFQTARETRGFVDMWFLICELEDSNAPAHPGKVVTARSLRKAFEDSKMSKKNADWLIKQATQYAKKADTSETISLSDALRIIGQVNNSSLSLGAIADRMHQKLMEERERMESMNERFNASLDGSDFSLGPTTVPFMLTDLASSSPPTDQALPESPQNTALGAGVGLTTSTSQPALQAFKALSDEELLMQEIKALESSCENFSQGNQIMLKNIRAHVEMHLNRAVPWSDRGETANEWYRAAGSSLVEKAANLHAGLETISASFEGVDYAALEAVPESARQALDVLCQDTKHPNGDFMAESESRLLETFKKDKDDEGILLMPFASITRADKSIKEMEKIFKKLGEQVTLLTADVRETSEAKNMISKAEQALRQARGNAGNSPSRAGPSGSAEASKSTGHSRPPTDGSLTNKRLPPVPFS